MVERAARLFWEAAKSFPIPDRQVWAAAADGAAFFAYPQRSIRAKSPLTVTYKIVLRNILDRLGLGCPMHHFLSGEPSASGNLRVPAGTHNRTRMTASFQPYVSFAAAQKFVTADGTEVTPELRLGYA